MSIKFYLLGNFRVESDADTPHEIRLPKLRKAKSLLAYLLFFHNKPHSRERLASLFWGDVLDERARDSLSAALGAIRITLRDSAALLLADRFAVQLNPGSVWIDMVEVEAGLRPDASREDQATALNLYKNDLLTDLQDDWVVLERERLRQRMIDTGTTLLSEHLSKQEWQAGVALAQRLIEQDPLDSNLHELLLKLLLGAGQRELARRHFQQHTKLLQTQLGFNPTDIAETFHSEIFRLPANASAAPRGSAPKAGAVEQAEQLPFIDRQLEQAQLQQALGKTRQGQGGVTLVSGAPGVGKTRLVQEALNNAQGFYVARCKAHELDAAAPFGILLRPLSAWLLEDLAPAQALSRLGPITATALSQIIPALGAVLPGLKPLPMLPPAEAQTQIVQALVAALQAIGRPPGAPAVLCLDDLHLADPQSLAVLGQLFPQLASAPLQIIATYRPEAVPKSGALDYLLQNLRQNAASIINLEPLSKEDIQTLIEPREPEPLLSNWLYQQSGGNPFFLTELLHGLAKQQYIAPDPLLGGWYLTAPDLPAADIPLTQAAQDFILKRFYQLSAAAQTILQIAAAARCEFSFADFVALSSLGEEEVLRGLEQAITHNFMQQRGDDCYSIEHELTRLALRQSLSETRRRYLLGRIAVIKKQC